MIDSKIHSNPDHHHNDHLDDGLLIIFFSFFFYVFADDHHQYFDHQNSLDLSISNHIVLFVRNSYHSFHCFFFHLRERIQWSDFVDVWYEIPFHILTLKQYQINVVSIRPTGIRHIPLYRLIDIFVGNSFSPCLCVCLLSNSKLFLKKKRVHRSLSTNTTSIIIPQCYIKRMIESKCDLITAI